MNNPAQKKRPFVIKRTTTEEYSSEPSSADAVIKAAYGAKMEAQSQPAAKSSNGAPAKPAASVPKQPLQSGGMAEGPSHAQGGIDVMQEDTGEQVAEIEGGERVFSVEDTQVLEEAAVQIQQAMQSGDKATAEDLAMRLGFAVVNMLAAQEQNQMAQSAEEGMPAANEQAAMEAANQFGQEAEMVPTI